MVKKSPLNSDGYLDLPFIVPEVHEAVVDRRRLGPLYGGQSPPPAPLHRGRSLRMRGAWLWAALSGQDDVHIPGAGPQQPPGLLHAHPPE